MKTLGMQKVRNWSRWLGLVSRFWLVGGPVTMVAQWLALPVLPGGMAKHLLDAEAKVITWRVQLLGILSSLPSMAVHVLLFLQLVRLLDLWKEGQFLQQDSARCFRRMGSLFLVGTLVEIASRPLHTLALTIDNPPGQRALRIGLGSDDVRTVFLGLFLWMLASIMALGTRYREETELTV